MIWHYLELGLTHLRYSPTTQIFLASTILITVALARKVLLHTKNLSSLQTETIGSIERTHVYIPSGKKIAVTVACALSLLIAALSTVGHRGFFAVPSHTLALIGLFVVTTVIVIILELLWKEMNGYTLAIIMGTSIAFALLIFHRIVGGNNSMAGATILMLLTFTVVFAWQAFFKRWTRAMSVVSTLFLIMWVVLYVAS